jgi:hypothetical protein
MSIEAVIFYILVIDSVSFSIMGIFGAKWYTKHFRTVSRSFPATEGWALYYLVLVIWIGSLLIRIGKI